MSLMAIRSTMAFDSAAKKEQKRDWAQKTASLMEIRSTTAVDSATKKGQRRDWAPSWEMNWARLMVVAGCW